MPSLLHSDASHHPSECFLSTVRKHFFDWCKAFARGIDDVRTSRPRHCFGRNMMYCTIVPLYHLQNSKSIQVFKYSTMTGRGDTRAGKLPSYPLTHSGHLCFQKRWEINNIRTKSTFLGKRVNMLRTTWPEVTHLQLTHFWHLHSEKTLDRIFILYILYIIYII